MVYFIKVCLWIQAFAILFALFVFGILADPRTAGSLAGPVFLMSGAMPMFGVIFKRLTVYTLGFWFSAIFTFFFSAPMLVKRVIFYGEAFSEITYYGLNSQAFHRLSGTAYLILFGALVWDLWKEKKKSV